MNIVAFAGKKGSGKSTLCNFLHGYFMKMHGLIDGFEITENGDLVIETDILDESNNLSKGKGIVDVRRLDIDFALWAGGAMWPIVKHYAFSTPLKEMAVELFGLNREHVYGSNEDKNNLTQYKWEDMPFKSKKTGFMTVREFLQVLGTEILRKIYNNVWVERAVKDIEAESPSLAVVSDLRHDIELDKIKEKGGKVIFLTGGEGGDDHSSETEFSKLTFDAIIDTVNQTVDESCHRLVELLQDWGIIPSEIIVESESKKSRGVGKIK